MNAFQRLFTAWGKASAVGFFTVAVALSGCTTQEKRSATPEELEHTAREVINTTVYLRTLAETCKTLGGEAAAHADRVYDEWFQRNWPSISVADQYFSDALKPQTITYQNQEIALPALTLLAENKQQVARKVGFKRRTSSGRAKACEKALAPYAAGERDLAADPANKFGLNTLRERYSVPYGETHPVPQLAGSLDLLDNPGRTLYSVESSLHAQGCDTPRLFTFKNDWPHEAYGAYCDNQRQLFITCEWGKCNIH